MQVALNTGVIEPKNQWEHAWFQFFMLHSKKLQKISVHSNAFFLAMYGSPERQVRKKILVIHFLSLI